MLQPADSQGLSDANVDGVIDQFLGTDNPPDGTIVVDLVMEAVDRSRTRFEREFSKLKASFDQNFFFTEDGVKARKEKLRLKAMVGEMAKEK